MIGEEPVRIEVRFEKRKRFLLTIEPPGFVKVKAPRSATLQAVAETVEEQRSWISMKLHAMGALKGDEDAADLEQAPIASTFRLEGRDYPVHVVLTTEQARVERSDSGLTVYVQQEGPGAISAVLKRYGFQLCKKAVQKRIQYWQPHFKVKPASVEIQESTIKWGQCSSQRRLSFNWQLIMAPPEALDYVVLHEMCHLIHMNHDRSFWRLLGGLMPDYMLRQQVLDRTGTPMEF